MGAVADIISFATLAIGAWLLHTGDLAGIAFVAYGAVHQTYFMPVIVMSMNDFINGENKVI
jgi:hypothetical protein